MSTTIIFQFSPTVAPSPLNFALSSLPLLGLVVYFLYLAYERPSERCYTETLTDDEIQSACRLISLKDVVLVHSMICFVWCVLALRLQVFLPRRLALLDEYILQGDSLLGNVYYEEPDKALCGGMLRNSHGYVTYLHPQLDKGSSVVRRQVRVMEHYSRERVTMLYLQNMPYSAQPKVDLEIELHMLQQHEERRKHCRALAWAWVAFCYCALLYLLNAVFDMGQVAEYEWQPDYGGKKSAALLCVVAIVLVPATAYVVIALAWYKYKKWMTFEHEVLPVDQGGA